MLRKMGRGREGKKAGAVCGADRPEGGEVARRLGGASLEEGRRSVESKGVGRGRFSCQILL